MLERLILCALGVLVTNARVSTQTAAERPLGSPRILQGPMLGAVTPTSVTIWMRLSAEVPVTIRWTAATDPDRWNTSESVVARRGNDRCVNVTLTDLAPATDYLWQPLVNGGPDKYLAGLPPFRVTTAPAGAAPLRVAFGSCARFQSDREQPIWRSIAAMEPDLFLWLGDNVYGDTYDPTVLAEEYRRQRDVASLQPLLRGVPQLAVWDDHDFGLNNHDRTSPVRDAALTVFRQYWSNPAYGTATAPGVFFQIAHSGIDWYFIDCRSYRDPNDLPDGPGKTMLGSEQLEWLKRGLAASSAPFKVIVSGSGWSAAKGSGGDSWASYRTERDALFDWIMANDVAGVVLVSGDTHVGELNCIPRSDAGGYDLYDLVSSPLAQLPETSWMNRRPELRIRNVFARSENFGVLDIDATRADPTLRFTLFDIRGREAFAPLELRASELRPGVRTWDTKASPGLRNQRARETPVDGSLRR